GLFRIVLEILLQAFVTFARHCEVAGENVVKRWNVSGTLDRRMAAQRENSTAGPANVAEKKLQDRSRTNDLHSLGMLRPTHRVTNRRCFLRTRCSNQRVRDLVKKRRRNAADFLHDRRCVAGEMSS